MLLHTYGGNHNQSPIQVTPLRCRNEGGCPDTRYYILHVGRWIANFPCQRLNFGSDMGAREQRDFGCTGSIDIRAGER